MTQYTVGFAGMDSDDEAEVRSLFERAATSLGGSLVDGGDQAPVLVIDVDTIYGHMTWLRAQGDDERRVIAISGRQTPHADICLVRPLGMEAAAAALQAARGEAASGAEPGLLEAGPQPPAAPVAEQAPEPEPAPALEPAPAPEPEPEATSAATPATIEVGQAADAAAQAPAPAEEPAPEPAPRRLLDYLRPGALPGPSRLQLDGAPALVVDPAAGTWAGQSQLKAFRPYAEAAAIDAAQWQPAEAPPAADAQPLSRLAWLAGLYAHPGRLPDGTGPGDRFQLNGWPQIEREYPRHFRIATAMMQAPSTPAEIAGAAGVPEEEVVDFISACLAAGQARLVREEAPPAEGGGRSGLLKRLKGLRGA